MRPGELQNGEDESGKDIFMFVDDFRPEVFVRKWNTGKVGGLAVLFFVMMRRNQIWTISGTINGDFALGAAADRADGFPFCRAVALRFSLRADGTTHQFSLCATRASVRKPSSGARWSGRPNDASSSLPNAERTGVRESLAGRGSGPAEQVLPAQRPSPGVSTRSRPRARWRTPRSICRRGSTGKPRAFRCAAHSPTLPGHRCRARKDRWSGHGAGTTRAGKAAAYKSPGCFAPARRWAEQAATPELRGSGS